MRQVGETPFRLDSVRPTIPFTDYAYNEIRYHALTITRPQEAEELARMAQDVVNEKYATYERLATRGGERFHPPAERVGANAAMSRAAMPGDPPPMGAL
jgi:pyruvate-ferredoxin/flavodoxin oxidoreductase